MHVQRELSLTQKKNTPVQLTDCTFNDKAAVAAAAPATSRLHTFTQTMSESYSEMDCYTLTETYWERKKERKTMCSEKKGNKIRSALEVHKLNTLNCAHKFILFRIPVWPRVCVARFILFSLLCYSLRYDASFRHTKLWGICVMCMCVFAAWKILSIVRRLLARGRVYCCWLCVAHKNWTNTHNNQSFSCQCIAYACVPNL